MESATPSTPSGAPDSPASASPTENKILTFIKTHKFAIGILVAGLLAGYFQKAGYIKDKKTLMERISAQEITITALNTSQTKLRTENESLRQQTNVSKTERPYIGLDGQPKFSPDGKPLMIREYLSQTILEKDRTIQEKDQIISELRSKVDSLNVSLTKATEEHTEIRGGVSLGLFVSDRGRKLLNADADIMHLWLLVPLTFQPQGMIADDGEKFIGAKIKAAI